MKVILISGKAEAGKSLTAKILKERLEANANVVYIVPYGQYVKDTAKMLFGWDGKKDEKGRELLQWWGTDIVRKDYPSFWVDTVIRLADVLKSRTDYLIVDDCRFPNEIFEWDDDWYDEWDILTVRVERPGHENALTPEQRQHASECALDDCDFNVRISATNEEELRKAVYERILMKLDI